MATQSKTKSWNIKEAILEAIGKTTSIIAGMSKQQAQEELFTPTKNYIINGDMQVSQRGDYTSATAISNATYYLDRWKTALNTVSGTLTHSTESIDGATVNTALLTATSTGTGYIAHYQFIENYADFIGRTITISLPVKANSSEARITVYCSGGSGTIAYSSAHSGDGNVEILTATVTVPSGAASLAVYCGLISTSTGTVSITSGDYIEFTNVSLKIGDTATPFESRSYAEELALCKGYWYQPDASGSAYTKHGLGYADSTTRCWVQIKNQFNNIADEVSFSNLKLTDGIGDYAVTAIAVSSASSTDVTILEVTVASGLTVQNVYELQNNNSTSGKLGVGNEL